MRIYNNLFFFDYAHLEEDRGLFETTEKVPCLN